MNRIHGESHATPEYKSWKKMRERCLQPGCKDYPQYGGRGINVAPEWDSYPRFLSDMGRRPSRSHSLGRKDNNAGYFKENCEWQTPKVQARNRRTSRFLTFRGETLTMAEWAERFGWGVNILLGRISRRNWSTERALTQPVRKRLSV